MIGIIEDRDGRKENASIILQEGLLDIKIADNMTMTQLAWSNATRMSNNLSVRSYT